MKQNPEWVSDTSNHHWLDFMQSIVWYKCADMRRAGARAKTYINTVDGSRDARNEVAVYFNHDTL